MPLMKYNNMIIKPVLYVDQDFLSQSIYSILKITLTTILIIYLLTFMKDAGCLPKLLLSLLLGYLPKPILIKQW